MSPEKEKAIQEKWYKLFPEEKRIKDAAQRILEVSTELHLTWRELEKAVERVKGVAYISSGSEFVTASSTQMTSGKFEEIMQDYDKEDRS